MDTIFLSFKVEFEKIAYKLISPDELVRHCNFVDQQIVRFAGEKSLSRYRTVHMVDLNKNACLALHNDCGYKWLVGLFVNSGCRQASYYFDAGLSNYFDNHIYYTDAETGLIFFNNALISNKENLTSVKKRIATLIGRPFIELIIHEQYYYSDYINHQQDFENKVMRAVEALTLSDYTSVFLKDLIQSKTKILTSA